MMDLILDVEVGISFFSLEHLIYLFHFTSCSEFVLIDQII